MTAAVDKKSIRLSVSSRWYTVPLGAVAVGAIIGLNRGAKLASLRFLAENAHRTPTTQKGWYYYHKTKNYRVILGALRGAGRDGGYLGLVSLGWVTIEEGLERVGWGRIAMTGAGVGTAGIVCGLYGAGVRSSIALGLAGGGFLDAIRTFLVLSSHRHRCPLRSALPRMLQFWPSTPLDQLTPRASAQETNPFDVMPNHPPRSPTAYHHLLKTPTGGAETPIASPSTGFVSALPTTSVTLSAPIFSMPKAPPAKRSVAPSSSATSSSPSGSSSKGQIHVKLIQARALNVRSTAKPYVVVQFEQNEFVSRDPTGESDKEIKGTPTSLNTSSAMTALNDIGTKAAAAEANRRGSRGSAKSNNSSPASSVKPTSTLSNGLFGSISATNPVWKHEVSFDVTSEASVITFNVYDRSALEHGFLGTVQIKPVLIHDHTVDQWYKLLPFENEVVSGEMRVQITYEQNRTKRALTPRDFEFLKLIGRGTFGKVFQVRKRDTKRIYAMKVLSKKEIVAKKEVAHTIGERKILQKSLESPFLVGLKFSFQTDTDLYLITDFKSGGELFWHLQRETRFTEERARFYIAELILALEHLHKYDIVYRDLKPENILLDATGHVALCDFGLSKADLRSDQLTTTFCGTTEYLAPEMLLDELGYSKLVDFWSLGVLLFEMCCGWSPFYAEDTQQMYKNICFGKIRFPKGAINEDGKQFVKCLLNRNPKLRLGAQRDAEELKEHPFFASLDWDALARKQVTPPFKPIVESDESTANFDEAFTSADLHEVGIDGMDIDENDPSEDWVLAGSLSQHHQPNGPLGSEREGHSASASPTPGQNGASLSRQSSTNRNGNGTGPRPKAAGIDIKPKKKKVEAAGSPLTNSVQENFRGFTYSGGESVTAPGGILAMRAATKTPDSGEDSTNNTEDEFEDPSKPAGRYAHKRRKGLGFTGLEDEF
ncbi:Non-specific serine/threonine protein kinase [Mycena indigotica]|uniref:Non-specific serine/threonine protein kinase n=1 Tax=Mycena indigotica TaxID=2126181 RepID=A0A8H6W3E2_9AGAR|nr:Non-specific serine/threonine protein kinase [Mycena indigotica]KAF7301471.1 Non-specific serine/threonine protein kinase [Mycena indigotica]